MCRNIKTLFNYEPPATDDEVRASSVQFVRKISGSTRPSMANQAAFDRAIDEVAATVTKLLDSLFTSSPAKDRGIEAANARARSAKRYAATASRGVT